MKFFLDENLSPQHAIELKSAGYDACAVVEVGLSGASDEQIRRFTIENNYILVTMDADFANVIRFPPQQTPGVVRLRIHPPTEERIRLMLRRAVVALENIDLRGRLAVVDERRIRIRH